MDRLHPDISSANSGDWPPPIEVLNEAAPSEIVLICEHASNHIPLEYNSLGVSPEDLRRHIAWDIGAAEVTRGLAKALDAPAFLGTYSRLLVDLNRPFGCRSSMPVRSEATDVPGNVGLSDAECERRRQIIFDPFHAVIMAHLDSRRSQGRRTRLVTIHSFTPVFLGVARPWHGGILFDRSRRFAEAVISGLSRDPTLNIASNEPYGIHRDEDYAVPVYGTDRGLPAILVEIRNDLISSPQGVAEWVARLTDVLWSPPPIDETVAKSL